MTEVIPADQYGYLEYHANSFAGLVLVPKQELRDAFFDYVEKGQGVGVDFDELGNGAREAAEEHIAGIFDVSAEVVHRRIEYDKLWHPDAE
jgi:Zn-dependent peptidase ImmA (M78 family)